MLDAGYLAKLVAPTPPALGVPPDVTEICSASECISSTAEGAVEAWSHNELRWYNSPELAWSVALVQ